MKISVAMATYNGAEYIQEQLQSFVDQTRTPDELIITDDCSTDKTRDIVREFVKNAPFKVELHRNEKNVGYCGNFNEALMKTTGDLVFLSDQDDVWFAEKIEYMIGVAERNPEALVMMNDALLTDAELNEVGVTKIGQIRSAGLPMADFVMGCCCVIRREFLNFCLPIPSAAKGHDSWIVSFAEGLECKHIDGRVLQYYRRHESNESQFIANRTNKITWLQARAYSLNKSIETIKLIIDGKNRQIDNDWFEEQQLKVRGIRQALSVAPKQYQAAIADLIRKSESDIKRYQQRVAVREKSLLPRILATLRLLFQGGYRNTSGLKAVLRDLVG